MTRIRTVDGLRGLAALIVVFDHVVEDRWGLGHWTEQNHGVTVFAILAGFLLSVPFLKARLDGRALPRTGVFLRARAVRVFPGYWVALLLAAPTVGLHLMDQPLDLPQVLTLTQTLGPDTPFEGLPPAWSLSLFLSFYVALIPWSRWRARSAADGRGGRWLLQGEVRCLLALVAAAWLVRLTSVTDPVFEQPVYSVLGRADWFAAGMLLAVVVVARDRGMVGSRLTGIGRRPGAAWLAALLVTSASMVVPVALEELRDQLDTVAAVLLVASVVLHGDRLLGPQRLLASRPAQATGRWSFGIFLWGYIAQKGIEQLWPSVPVGLHLVATIACAVAAGAASWRFVEQPAMARWAKRDGAARRAEPLPVTAARATVTS